MISLITNFKSSQSFLCIILHFRFQWIILGMDIELKLHIVLSLCSRYYWLDIWLFFVMDFHLVWTFDENCFSLFIWSCLILCGVILGEFDLETIKRIIFHVITLQNVICINYSGGLRFCYSDKIWSILIPGFKFWRKPFKFIFNDSVFGWSCNWFHLEHRSIGRNVKLLQLFVQILHNPTIFFYLYVTSLTVFNFDGLKSLSIYES